MAMELSLFVKFSVISISEELQISKMPYKNYVDSL